MQYGKRKLLEQKMGRILICRNRRGQAKAQAGETKDYSLRTVTLWTSGSCFGPHAWNGTGCRGFVGESYKGTLEVGWVRPG